MRLPIPTLICSCRVQKLHNLKHSHIKAVHVIFGRFKKRQTQDSVRRGLVARIPGFHPGGPGSIPGVGISRFVNHNVDFYLLLNACLNAISTLNISICYFL